VAQAINAGVITPDADGRHEAADIRRLTTLQAILRAGVPFEAIAEAVRRGAFSFGFLADPEYDRFDYLSDETFDQASLRTGVPVEQLTQLRESLGLGTAYGHDRVRGDEQRIIESLAIQHRMGFDFGATERFMRTMGDSLRRTAEAEAEWWRSQVLTPGLESGRSTDEIGRTWESTQLGALMDNVLLAIYHVQQTQTWTSNIVSAAAYQLAAAGIHQVAERDPAICFLDITGYTRLTQERGDAAAAALAETLGRLVKRASLAHDGRPVKWLGDGVMCWFRDPGPAVAAALEMVDGVVSAGLPPAHVGVHTGPVVIQEGDYYGATVNLAARIAEYARPGEVLVSQAVVDAASRDDAVANGLSFAQIGPVDLKGVSGGVVLHAARRA
jgi:class 3 adenylate cyclase